MTTVRLTLLLVSLLLSATLDAQAAPIVKGDGAAWIEIVGAYRRLGRLRTYRVKMTGRTSGLLEVINPDRFHIITKVEGLVVETIQVGTKARVREGKAWRCADQSGPPPVSDPTWLAGELTVARQGVTVIDGTVVRTYRYEQWRGRVSAARTLYVGVDTGLPIRLDVFDPSGKHERRLQYYDFDKPITITLPPCS